MRIPGLVCFTVFSLWLPAWAAAQGSLRDALIAARDRHGVPALAAAVTNSDRILEIGAVGVGQLGRPDAVLPTDRFHLSTLNMAMTATVLATLVEEGQLRWESRVVDLFPEMAATTRAEYATVTLADLLTHLAGFAPFVGPSELDALALGLGSPIERRAAFTRHLLSQPPAGPPGAFLLSNAGYSVAAAAAERVTGLAYEDLIRVRLFEPLGMAAGFDWPALLDSAQPWGHWLVADVLTPHDPNGEYHVQDVIRPAGDLQASVGDYVLFLQLHLRGLRGRESFLSRETFERLHRPPEGSSSAFGWFISVQEGTPVSVQTGGAGTFEAFAGIVPERDLGAIVVANAGHPAARDAVNDVVNAIVQKYNQPR
jgi:CubicO group peptidase (beta-lactamase class C family)